MVHTFVLRTEQWLSALPAPAKDIAFLTLFFAPSAAFLAACIVYGCRRSARRGSKCWFLLFSCGCSLLLCAFAVLSLGSGAVRHIAFSLAALALGMAEYAVLCLIGRERAPEKRGKRRKKKTPSPEEFFEEEAPLPPPVSGSAADNAAPMPRLVRCFGSAPEQDAAPSRPLKDVRLDYVLSVAERLKELPLGAGDRLEAEKMGGLLQIYKNKGELSPAEYRALNDVLAALLKMMAKYGV